MAFSSDGHYLAVTFADTVLRILDLQERHVVQEFGVSRSERIRQKEVAEFAGTKRLQAFIHELEFESIGGIVRYSNDGALGWCRGGELRRSSDDEFYAVGVSDHCDDFRFFEGEPSRMVVSGYDQGIREISSPCFSEVSYVVPAHPGPYFSLAVSDQLLIFQRGHGEVAVADRDLRQGTTHIRKVFPSPVRGGAASVALSPDGKFLALGYGIEQIFVHRIDPIDN